MDNVEKTVRHHWQPMEEYRPNVIEQFDLMEEEQNKADIIRKLKSNQYIILAENGDVNKFNLIINQLKQEGLDIEKGNHEYGWKMPLIGKRRELRIFKRH